METKGVGREGGKIVRGEKHGRERQREWRIRFKWKRMPWEGKQMTRKLKGKKKKHGKAVKVERVKRRWKERT